jgi:RimJ/RimL family protein N-acetyltransferase|tara:strand:+ start:89 stop:553 length:465 start_codon:yes stop_codon:yes gene_type:complete
MASIALRPFGMEDSKHLSQWYQDDRDGIEAFMGADIPTDVASTMAFNVLLEKQQQQTAIFRMVYRDDEAIGFVAVTDISISDRSGRPHWYVAKDKRKYSMSVARESEREAQRLGFRGFLASIPPDNKAALAVVKRLGYTKLERIVFVKEFDNGN